MPLGGFAFQLQNRQPFSYDPEKDPTYQQYKAQYERGAQKSMQDTMGQVMARTGGLASSFAQTAGQQSYNAAMAQLADKVPELRQLAYQMYMDEGNRLRSDLQMYDSLDSSDASRWQATVLSPFQPDRAYALDVDNTLYNRGRDALSDQRYEQEYADKRADVGREWAYKERQDQEARDKALADLLASGGNYSGYGFLGLSPEDAAALGALWSEDRDYAKRDADLDLISKQLGIDLTRKQIANYGKDAYRRTEDTPTPPEEEEPRDPMPPAIYTGLTQRVKTMLSQGDRNGAIMFVYANIAKLSEEQTKELTKLLGLDQ